MDFEDINDLLDLALIGAIGYAAQEAYNEEKKQRKIHCEEMQEKDPEQFFKMTRMTPKTFQLLLALIEQHLEKSSWRQPISPSCRLFLVLIYLSQGVSKDVLAWMFGIGVSTVHTIIYETCDVIWTILMPLYLQPISEDKWKQNAIEFEKIWNLPNCVAAIDGKHVNIRCPPHARSEIYNYKRDHSIMLLAACDADYIFVAVDVGACGSQSDGGILSESLKESSFGKNLLSNNINLPAPSFLSNTSVKCNYYLVGDAAFPLKPYLMRPYPGKLLSVDKLNFNIRLSRARQVIENAFGILVARWRILETTLNMLPENAEKIIKSTVVLHNFIKRNDAAYCPSSFVDTCDENNVIIQEGQWRNEANALSQARIGSNFSSREAKDMRDLLKDYLFESYIKIEIEN